MSLICGSEGTCIYCMELNRVVECDTHKIIKKSDQERTPNVLILLYFGTIVLSQQVEVYSAGIQWPTNKAGVAYYALYLR